MSVTIQARTDAMAPDDAVEATGSTLPHAVRAAIRKLGLGIGRTIGSEKVGPSQWRWDWSGKTIHVVQVADRNALTNAHRARRMVTITLSDGARTKLDALAVAGGETRSGTVERLIQQA